MNISVYAFGQFEMGYSQYPDDYTGDIFTEFYKHSKAKTQIAIHRDGSLMYYGYIRKLEDNKYIGLCAVVNGQMFLQIMPLFSIFENIIEELVYKGQLIQLDSQGNIVSNAQHLYLEEDDIMSLSYIMRNKLEKLQSCDVPPLNYSVSKDSVQDFNCEDNAEMIMKSVSMHGYTFIYKSNDYDTGKLKGYKGQIATLNKEQEKAQQEISDLKKELRKKSITNISPFWGLIFGSIIVLMLLIIIHLSKQSTPSNNANEITPEIVQNDEDLDSVLSITENEAYNSDYSTEEIVEDSQNTIANEEVVEDENPLVHFNFEFKGKINDKYDIAGNLYTYDNRVYGRYYYMSTMRKCGDVPETYITFHGTKDNYGNIHLSGQYYDEDLVEIWEGQLGQNRYDEYEFCGTIKGKGKVYTVTFTSI